MLRNKPIRRPGTTAMGRRELSGLYADDDSSLMTAIEAAFTREKPRRGSCQWQYRKMPIAAHLERVWV